MKLMIRRYILSLVFVMQFAIGNTQTDILISEILASNVTQKYNTDKYNFGDWIELCNNSSTGKNLMGYYLTDDRDELFKYEIFYYFYLNPGESKIIWADKYDGFMHTNFSLDSDGEFLALVDPSGQIVDSVTFGQQYPDISFGRRNSNESIWHYYSNPTPGNSNGVGLEKNNFSPDVKFSIQSGFCQGSQIVELTCDSVVNSIRYTLDGKFPTKNSSLYTGPLNITSNTTIRARSYTDNKLPSPIISNSYFIDEESPTLPVVSISTDSKFLFDWIIGIYVAGTNGIIGNCIDTAVNFNQDWERPVNFEYFLPDGKQVINQQVGVKINGGCSRHVPLKSFAVYAREKYGKSNMDFGFFANKPIDEYHNLILRNTGNDYYFSYMRDGFMQAIIADVTDIDYQSYQPARIYLNGDYWGILNLREKLNEHYLASNFGVNPDSVDLLESNQEVIEGSNIHYQNMMDFLRTNDITQPANYEYLNTQMDISQFIDYCSAQVFFENEDWPHHNIKFWRPRTDKGRWRWLLYDTDYGFGRWPRTGNTVKWAFREDDWSTELGATVIKNNDFRNEFVQRFAVRLNTTYAPERVIHILDSLVVNMETEMHLHIANWGSPYSHEKWLNEVQELRDFAINRVPLLFSQFNTYFNLEGTANLYVKTANPECGEVLLHDISVNDSASVKLFKNLPIRIKAKPIPGFQFSHWEGASNSFSDTLILTLNENDSLVAHFKIAEPIAHLTINEVSSKSVNGIADEFGEIEDWIEIYNADTKAINLEGLFLTDSLDDPFKYEIHSSSSYPIFVPSQDFIIFYADNDEEQGDLHLNFKLNNDGESIALIQKTGDSYIILDSLTFSKQYENLTYGRYPDGDQQLQLLNPTPDTNNQEIRITGIVINEYMAANRSVVADENGEFDDWIELYNASDIPVNVAGIFLTDSLADKTRYRLPLTDTDSLTIYPNEHLLLWADNQPEQGIKHLGFKLNGDSEAIGLVQQNGIDFIDSLEYPDISRDVAMGRLPDGSQGFQITTPTPGSKNKVDTILNLFINEFCAANNSIITDEFGEYNDWIEIYNDNDFPVDIGGLYISDSLDNPADYRIPSYAPDSTTVPARGFLLLWADNQPEQGILHVGFKLSGDGEAIGLVQQNGIDYIDSIEYPDISGDVTMGRIPDGSPEVQFTTPTPGSSNKVDTFHNLYINEFCSSNRSIITDEFGEYNDWIEIYNDNDFPVDIGGLYITDSLGQPNKFRIPSHAPDSTTIPAKDFILLWGDKQPEQGVLHLDFKLSSNGEAIGLVQQNGTNFIDYFAYPDISEDVTMGRVQDGSTGFQFTTPTPGNSNKDDTIRNIYINEYCSSNLSILSDEFGEYNDWIEIYNDNDFPVDIGGLYMTDSLGHPAYYRIPSYAPDSTTIPAKDFILLWADNQPEQGVLHLDFKLSRNGEQIGLSLQDGKTYIDSLSFTKSDDDITTGRYPDGSKNIHLLIPTPQSSNYFTEISNVFITEISASSQSSYSDEYGEYDDWIEILNSNEYPVNIGGTYITDSLANTTKYRIPDYLPDSTTIPANGRLILWADNEPEQGILHLNFKLSGDGEQIGLINLDGVTYIDSATFPDQYANYSYGKLNDIGEWTIIRPTPMNPNHDKLIEGIYINEFMADNINRLTDEYGEYDDWVELYNSNSYPVDIGGYYLSDSLNNPGKYRIPSNQPENTTIPANDYLIIFTDNSSEQGPLHTNFKLNRSGEEIGLFHSDANQIIDEITYDEQYKNFASAKLEEDNKWYSVPPTPGIKNDIPDLSGLFINEFMPYNDNLISDNYGEYDDWIELYNGGELPIDIGGLFFTDSLRNNIKHRIPSTSPDSTTIEPGSYLILWSDSDEEQGILHIGFKLSREQEELGIFNYKRELIDSVSYIAKGLSSYGRRTDGISEWIWMSSPTPGRSNTITLVDRHEESLSDVLVFPNPMNEIINFIIKVNEPETVTLKIYSQTGELISLKQITSQSAESIHFEWNGRNMGGYPISSGIYVYKIVYNTKAVTGHFIKL